MVYQVSPAVERLIRDQMATGKYASEEELLVEALRALEQEVEDLRAISEVLDAVDQGEAGVTVDEAFRRLREQNVD
ncbi:MAG: type II toxin-antitoxin system ParD family antitoxin [Pirellulales bacterium]